MKYKNSNSEWIDLKIKPGGDTLPVGTIVSYAGSVAPGGWLFCDGSMVSKITYADLYTAIGNTYTTTTQDGYFAVPNLNGKIPVGLNSSDTDFATLGKTGGEKTHTLTTSEMPSHTHSSVIRETGVDDSNFSGHIANAVEANDTSNTKDTLTTGATGGGNAHNNLQPYLTVNYIIKAQNIAALILNQGVVSQDITATEDNYIPSCETVKNYVDTIAKNNILNKDLSVTDGSYYNLTLDRVAKDAIYSTDEIKVGAWIDGRPIYRKVISTTSSTGGQISTGLTNIRWMVNAYGMGLYNGNIYLPFNFYNSGGWNTFHLSGNGAYIQYQNNSSYQTTTVVFVLEYTKTTD